jgi:hypothetical protein
MENFQRRGGFRRGQTCATRRKGQDMTIATRAAAALLAVLLAACEGYGPTAPAGDSVEAETINPDASGTGGIDDAYGTEMP